MSYELLFLQVAFIAQVKSYEFILFITRLKNIKSLRYSVCIKVCNKYILFWRGSEECAFHVVEIFYFVEILSKNE